MPANGLCTMSGGPSSSGLGLIQSLPWAASRASGGGAFAFWPPRASMSPVIEQGGTGKYAWT
eukprot:1907490-Heterocapsa_arctica.AAC.1